MVKLPNGNSLLTVVFPKREVQPKPADEPPAAADPQQLQMMRQVLKGMKIGIAVEVQEKLVKTNSTYAEGNKVTLLEMDLGELLNNEGKFKEFATRQPDSVEETKKLLKDVKGFKVTLEPEITIEFTGK